MQVDFLQCQFQMRPGKECTCACFGMLCIFQSARYWFFDNVLNVLGLLNPKTQMSFRRKVESFMKHRMVMCPSFFGLEETNLFPPNFQLTGPNVKVDQEAMMNILKKDHM